MKRVLLIEDDEAIATMYRVGLEAGGWRVEVEQTGERGLESALTEPPTMILLDIMLPKLGGLEVLRRLRSNPDTLGCPVVILTNSASLPQMVDEASRLGVVDWMVKSRTTPRELVARLSAFQEGDPGS